jgi:hypothetical protein
MARGLEVGGPNKSKSGHAFMVITVATPTGVTSSAYGFYPRDGGLGLIKGPGMLRSEFRCTKEECLALSASALGVRETVTVPATQSEHLKVLALIDEYNGPKLWGPGHPTPEYRLTTENCNAFVGEIAQALGYPTPSPATLPTEYLATLKSLIKAEQERRGLEAAQRLREEAEAEAERARQARVEAEADAEQARRDRIKEDQRRRDAEEKARRERERLAKQAPPAGWVRCNCPNAHTQYGGIYRGSRWHPEGPNCPN